MARYRRLGAPLLLLLALLLFVWPYITPNAADRGSIRGGDVDSQYYSLARWASVRLAQGELPLWNGDVFGGSPFVAEPQAAFYYPPRWATLALGLLLNGAGGLPFWLFELELFAHLWLAGLLTYAFQRRVGLSPTAALAGALIFTFSGFLTTYPLEQVSLLEAAVWLPGVLLGVEQGVSGSRRGWLLAAAALALSFLAGSPQITLYIGYAALAYAFWRGGKVGRAWRALLPPVAGWMAATALLAAAQLVPTLELMLRSPRARSAYDAVSSGFGFPDLLELFLPHATTIHGSIYIGLLPLALVLVPFLRARRGEREPALHFWAGVALVALFFSFGGGSAFFGWLYWLAPGVGWFRSQERVILLFAFAVAMLAAYGLQALMREPRGAAAIGAAKLTAAGAAALLAGTVAAYFLAHPTLPGWAFAALMAGLAAALMALGPAPRRLAAFAIALLLIDLFTVHGRTAWQGRPPERHERTPGLAEPLPRGDRGLLLDVESGLQPNVGAFLGVPAVSGASPLRLAAYDALREALPPARWWALWGVTHVASARPSLDLPATPLAESTVDDVPHVLYRLDVPAPRAAVAPRVEVVPDAAERLARLAADGAPLLLEAPPPAPAGGNGAVSRIAAGHERWEVEVTAEAPTLLRLSLPHYPGWRAEVDGAAAPLLRADSLWSAVPVPAGAHTVTLRFLPLRWAAAALVSLAAWAGLLFLALRGPRKAPAIPREN